MNKTKKRAWIELAKNAFNFLVFLSTNWLNGPLNDNTMRVKKIYFPMWNGSLRVLFIWFCRQKWVDGGLSDNLPRLPFGRTIRISPFSGKHYDICPQDASHGFTDVTFHNMNIYVNRANLQRELQIFLPPKREGIESLVQLGFDDALRFLQRENLCSYPLITQNLALPVIKSRQLWF